MKRLTLLGGLVVAGGALVAQPIWGEPGIEKISVRVLAPGEELPVSPPAPAVANDAPKVFPSTELPKALLKADLPVTAEPIAAPKAAAPKIAITDDAAPKDAAPVEPAPAAAAPAATAPAAAAPSNAVPSDAAPRDGVPGHVVLSDVEPGKATPGHVVAGEAMYVHDDHQRGRQSCWGVSADILYLTARGNSIPYAQVQDGEGALGVPAGAVGVVDSDYSTGIRLGGWRNLSHGNSVYLGFSWFSNSSGSTLEAPADTAFIIRPLSLFDPINNATADSLAAAAQLGIQYYTIELDFRHALCADDCFGLNLILGGRFAHLDQDFTAQYSVLGGTTVNSRINFDGAGPRFGLDGRYNLGANTFVYGRSDISFLVGHFGANYLQENVFVGVQTQTNSGDDRIVPILETELGIGWRSPGGRWDLTAGYTAAFWFNTMTTATWIPGVQETSFSTNRDNLRDTLTFDGLFLRAGFHY